jgi:hypothetical protein
MKVSVNRSTVSDRNDDGGGVVDSTAQEEKPY